MQAACPSQVSAEFGSHLNNLTGRYVGTRPEWVEFETMALPDRDRECHRLYWMIEESLKRKQKKMVFRSTLEELKQLPAFTGAPEKFRAWAEERAASDLRWQIILARFTGEDELAQEFQLNENTISEKDLTSHENC